MTTQHETTTDPDQPPTRPPRRRRWTSIRWRIIRIILIPSVPLVLLSLTGAVYLVGNGWYVRAVVLSVRQVSLPALSGLASLEKERQLSLTALAAPSATRHGLIVQRQTSDRKLASMRAAADAALAEAPEAISTRMRTLTRQLDQLPAIRATIDARAINRTDAAAYYNGVLDTAYGLFDTQARIVPDATATQGAIAATTLFRATDLMSRAGSSAAGAFSSGHWSAADYLAFTQLVGAYHAQVGSVEQNLRPDVHTDAGRLLRSDTWQRLTAAEHALIVAGPWQQGIPANLPVNQTAWASLTDTVSGQLAALTHDQGDEVSAQALSDGNTKLLLAGVGSAITWALALAAIVLAIRQSGALVHRTLIPRLRTLGEDADRVVRRCVTLIDALRNGDDIDLAAARPELTLAAPPPDTDREPEHGIDEISRVALVINRAVGTAVDAAVDEAESREGARVAVQGIARRNQAPLQQILARLDQWEQVEQDDRRMSQFFQLHHLARQVRVVNDGLIIVSGGKPGRQYRHPQQLLDVLRSAIADASDYRRVTLGEPPQASLVGSAVTSVIPLVTQLINNALEFSDPDTDVAVRCHRVAAGVAVEIEDRGAGMAPEVRDHANAVLRDAPAFTVAALGQGQQLGLWVVARLAHAQGVRVELRESVYGGVLAILLIPTTLLATSATTSPSASTSTSARRTVEGSSPPAPLPAHRGPGPLEGSRPSAPHLADRPGRVPVAEQAALGAPPPARRGGQPHPHPHPQLTPGSAHPVAPDQTHPATDPQPAHPVAPPPASRARHALPERRPQHHLAPQLRTEATAGQPDPPRSDPDTVRRQLSALQHGTQAGRRHCAPTHRTTATDRNETQR